MFNLEIYDAEFITELQRLNEKHRRALLWIVQNGHALQGDATRFLRDEHLSVRLLHAILRQWCDDRNDRYVADARTVFSLLLQEEIITIETEAQLMTHLLAKIPPPSASSRVIKACQIFLVRRRFAAFTRLFLCLRFDDAHTYTFCDFLWKEKVEGISHIFNYIDYYTENGYYLLEFLSRLFDNDSTDKDFLTQLNDLYARPMKHARFMTLRQLRERTLQILFDGNRGDFTPPSQEAEMLLPLGESYYGQIIDPFTVIDDEMNLTELYALLDNLLWSSYFSLTPPHNNVLLFSTLLHLDVAFHHVWRLIGLILRRLAANLHLKTVEEDSLSEELKAARLLTQRSTTFINREKLDSLVLREEVLPLEEGRERVVDLRKELLRRLRWLLVAREREKLTSQRVAERLTQEEDEEEAPLRRREACAVDLQCGEHNFIMAGQLLKEEDYRSLARFGLFLSNRLVTLICHEFLESSPLLFYSTMEPRIRRLMLMNEAQRQQAFQIGQCFIEMEIESIGLSDDLQSVKELAEEFHLRLTQEHRPLIILLGNDLVVDDDQEVHDLAVSADTAFCLLLLLWRDGAVVSIHVGPREMQSLSRRLLLNLEAFGESYESVNELILVASQTPLPHQFYCGYMMTYVAFYLNDYAKRQARWPLRDLLTFLQGHIEGEDKDMEPVQRVLLTHLNDGFSREDSLVKAYLLAKYESANFATQHASDEEKVIDLLERLHEMASHDSTVGETERFLAPMVHDLLGGGSERFEAELLQHLSQIVTQSTGERNYEEILNLLSRYREEEAHLQLQYGDIVMRLQGLKLHSRERMPLSCSVCGDMTWLVEQGDAMARALCWRH